MAEAAQHRSPSADHVELDSIDGGVIVNRACVGGPAAERFDAVFAGTPKVGFVDEREWYEIDRLDFDLAATDAVAAAGFDLRPAPEPE